MEKFSEDLEKNENFEHKKLRVRNEIQKSIMSLLCSPDEGPTCFIDWIDGNGEKFETLFEKALSNEPELLQKWDSQRDEIVDRFVGEFQEPENREERAA